MASFLENQEDVHLAIPAHETTDGVTYYVVEINIGPIKWSVKHR